ncbi:MAG TPA: YciI family protein [Vicinamibacteria bacterium]
MADTPGEGWEKAEREALERMGSSPLPQAAQEDAVVRRLRREGLLAPRRRWEILAAVAAGLALFALGHAWGGRARGPDGPRFVLFVHDTPASAATTEAGVQERVREYGAWARDQRAANRLVSGAKLSDEVVVLEGGRPPVARREETGEAGGYFVISAPDLAQALAVAGTCPHLRHGGIIVVRRVDG